MGMQIVITSRGSGPSAPLSLEVSGYRLELSGLPEGQRLTVTEDGGGIAVAIIEGSQEAQPSVEGSEAIPAAEADAPENAAEAPEEVRPETAEEEEALFQKLAALRKTISSEAKLPPYVIFHDATLREMCRLLPADLEALQAIQGVGRAKLEKYGMRFLEAIREHAQEKAA